MNPRLTPTAQGHNDIYWCGNTSAPVIITSDLNCSSCYTKNVTLDENRHQFLAHVYNGDDIKNEVFVLAEVVKGTDDAEAEIEVLRGAISQFAQQVHQAYHGAHPPDASNVNHHDCPRGLCRSVQHVLNPRRLRGMS